MEHASTALSLRLCELPTPRSGLSLTYTIAIPSRDAWKLVPITDTLRNDIFSTYQLRMFWKYSELVRRYNAYNYNV